MYLHFLPQRQETPIHYDDQPVNAGENNNSGKFWE
jgi:hypothetical protein